MKGRRLLWVAACAAMLLVFAAVWGATAANSVLGTRADDRARTTLANDLKPPECAAVLLVNKVSGSGTVTGTALNDFVTAGPAADIVAGDLGDDCILGGGGNDVIDGGLLGTDICIGGPGLDTFANCETQIQ